MSSFLTFITAVCTGISAGCFFYLGAKAVSGAKLDAKEQESTRNLPILMRLLRPLCGLFRPVASRSELSAWKSSCAVNLKMAGFTEDEFNGEDYLAMRFVFFAISLFMLILGVFSGRGDRRPWLCGGGVPEYASRIGLLSAVRGCRRNCRRSGSSVHQWFLHMLGTRAH